MQEPEFVQSVKDRTGPTPHIENAVMEVEARPKPPECGERCVGHYQRQWRSQQTESQMCGVAESPDLGPQSTAESLSVTRVGIGVVLVEFPRHEYHTARTESKRTGRPSRTCVRERYTPGQSRSGNKSGRCGCQPSQTMFASGAGSLAGLACGRPGFRYHEEMITASVTPRAAGQEASSPVPNQPKRPVAQATK